MVLVTYPLQLSPAITNDSSVYVHHIIVYLCTALDHSHVGSSVECDNAHLNVRQCRGGTVIATWAVGGTVSPKPKETVALHVCIIMTLFHVSFCDQDFFYPENVAYPVGGPGEPEFVVLEMHYDNPQLVSGMILCDVTGMVIKMLLLKVVILYTTCITMYYRSC